MPKDEEKSFSLLPEGEYRFQVTDIKTETEDYAQVLCEVVDNQYEGKTILYRVVFSGKFLWLTKLFLKCIGEPHNEGDLVIDTEAWIGRRFTGKVVHKNGYANIRELIYKDEPQVVNVVKSNDIQWGE